MSNSFPFFFSFFSFIFFPSLLALFFRFLSFLFFRLQVASRSERARPDRAAGPPNRRTSYRRRCAQVLEARNLATHCGDSDAASHSHDPHEPFPHRRHNYEPPPEPRIRRLVVVRPVPVLVHVYVRQHEVVRIRVALERQAGGLADDDVLSPHDFSVDLSFDGLLPTLPSATATPSSSCTI